MRKPKKLHKKIFNQKQLKIKFINIKQYIRTYIHVCIQYREREREREQESYSQSNPTLEDRIL